MTKNVALNKRRFMRRSVAACAGSGLTVLKLSGSASQLGLNSTVFVHLFTFFSVTYGIYEYRLVGERATNQKVGSSNLAGPISMLKTNKNKRLEKGRVLAGLNFGNLCCLKWGSTQFL
jgi:hypothetical protein